MNLYDLDPVAAARKLTEQSENLGISLAELLGRLKKLVPTFVQFFCEEQGMEPL